jgi:hypothetical protein
MTCYPPSQTQHVQQHGTRWPAHTSRVSTQSAKSCSNCKPLPRSIIMQRGIHPAPWHMHAVLCAPCVCHQLPQWPVPATHSRCTAQRKSSVHTHPAAAASQRNQIITLYCRLQVTMSQQMEQDLQENRLPMQESCMSTDVHNNAREHSHCSSACTIQGAYWTHMRVCSHNRACLRIHHDVTNSALASLDQAWR